MGIATDVPERIELCEVRVEPKVGPAGLLVKGWSLIRRAGCEVAGAVEWLFGLGSLVVGLSMLAALPLVQFLTLGYFLESSARVARSGRLRDGLVGVRRAAMIGGVAAGIWLSLIPAWLVGSYARSAELIDPGGRIAHGWRLGLMVVTRDLAHAYRRCVRPRRPAAALLLAAGPSFLAGPAAPARWALL